ncbi:MAG TPA: ACP phosphodiesterase [Geobacteraceae bacterium]
MNFLAHLYLSGDVPELLVGNLMGDFVKGRLAGRFPPGIRAGLELHRGIDSFAHNNEIFMASKRRIDPSFRHYRGVLVDLFYDHFLALDWDDYRDEPLPHFLERAERILKEHREVLPERLLRILPALFGDWLPSYRRIDGIGEVLGRMSGRIGRPNPLQEGVHELRRNYAALRGDFRRFLQEATAYAAGEIDRLTGRREPPA